MVGTRRSNDARDDGFLQTIQIQTGTQQSPSPAGRAVKFVEPAKVPPSVLLEPVSFYRELALIPESLTACIPEDSPYQISRVFILLALSLLIRFRDL